MKTVGIIAEYNPFHNGHAWQLQKAKEMTGADFAVVVMSGDFVQRGIPAWLDKFSRTRMALSCGADLVVELPVQYACSSAEYFARGSARLLNGLGVIDTVCFGCETDVSHAFSSLAKILFCEPEEYQHALRSLLSEGHTFPKARLLALTAYLESTSSNRSDAAWFADILSAPNNTLGLEYQIAALRQHCSYDFLPLKRQESGYHDLIPGKNFASATYIRNHPDDASRYIPAAAWDIFKQYRSHASFHIPDAYSSLLHYALIQTSHYERFLDVSSDLSDRIANLLPDFSDVTGFISSLKTRQLTETRITRSLFHILLGIRSELFSSSPYPGLGYARVLGFRQSSSPLLSEIKKRGTIPLLTKPAAARKMLSSEDYKCFELNFRASSIYHCVEKTAVNEYSRPLIIL